MNRRAFLVGAGTATVASGALLASGSFSQTGSQRQVTIETVGDEDAYLKLLYGEQTVECAEEIELVTLTNQLTDQLDNIAVEITSESDTLLFSDPVVPEELAVGESSTVTVDALCLPDEDETQTVTFDVEVAGADNTVNAEQRSIELTCLCDDPPESDATGIEFVAFCSNSEPVTVRNISITETVSADETDSEGAQPTAIEWTTENPVTEVVVHGDHEWYRFVTDGATTGTASTSTDDADEFGVSPSGYDSSGFARSAADNPFGVTFSDGTERRPESPCGCDVSTKVTVENGSFAVDEPTITEDDC